MSQFSLWLYPLIFATSFGLVLNIRAGIKYTYGTCLQYLLILTIGIMGFLIGPYWLWAAIGWLLFLSFTIVVRILLTQMQASIALFDIKRATWLVRILKLCLWGPPAELYSDVVNALKEVSEGNAQAALGILNKWKTRHVPAASQAIILISYMNTRIIMRDWSSIIAIFEDLNSRHAASSQIALAAVRAYSELGLTENAARALIVANLPSLRLDADPINIILTMFFSLAGELEKLQAVIAKLKSNVLPEYAKYFWLARCYERNQQYELAAENYKKTRELVPPANKIWLERCNYYANNPSPPGVLQNLQSKGNATSEVSQIAEQAKTITNIVSPKSKAIAVNCIVFVLIAIYLLSNSGHFFDVQTKQLILTYTYGLGTLDPQKVMSGEWWRLFTHLFLHVNISHLIFNIFALLWFGKLIENLFGSGKFLLIYILAGILSGVSHVFLNSDLAAIGASGAIMGVFGAGIASIMRLKQYLPKNIYKTELTWMLALAIGQIVLDQTINIVAISTNGTTMPRIASFAHLGGMVSGFLIGMLMPFKKNLFGNQNY